MSATEPSEALPKEDAHSAILALHSCDERVAELIISVVANCDYEQSDTDNNEGKVSKTVMQVKEAQVPITQRQLCPSSPAAVNPVTKCFRPLQTITL